MRILTTTALLSTLLLPLGGQAEDAVPLDRVKTAILPNGGFYALYEVACSDDQVAAVASVDRRQRWCTQTAGTLTCYRTPALATAAACATPSVAAAATTGNEATN